MIRFALGGFVSFIVFSGSSIIHITNGTGKGVAVDHTVDGVLGMDTQVDLSNLKTSGLLREGW